MKTDTYEYELPYDDSDVPRNGIVVNRVHGAWRLTVYGEDEVFTWRRVQRKRFPYHTLHKLQDKYDVPSLGKRWEPKFNRMKGWDFPIKLVEKT